MQLLVLVDAIVAGRLRSVEAGQQEGRLRTGRSSAWCALSSVDTSAEARRRAFPHHSHSNRNELPCCQYIRGQRWGSFQGSNRATCAPDRRSAFAVENSVVNGGSSL